MNFFLLLLCQIRNFLQEIIFIITFQTVFSFILISTMPRMLRINFINLTTLSDSLACIIILDISIKNHIAFSILHVYFLNQPIIKICHQAINMSTIKAELFAIRYDINQAISILHIRHIIVMTNSLYTIKKIFNSLLHSYQIHSAAIICELREFFNKYTNNYIKFQNCPNKKKLVILLSS